jgi:hypothetical protein
MTYTEIRKYAFEMAVQLDQFKNGVTMILETARRIENYIKGVTPKNVYVVDVPEGKSPEEIKKYIDDIMSRYTNGALKEKTPPLSVPLQAVNSRNI